MPRGLLVLLAALAALIVYLRTLDQEPVRSFDPQPSARRVPAPDPVPVRGIAEPESDGEPSVVEERDARAQAQIDRIRRLIEAQTGTAPSSDTVTRLRTEHDKLWDADRVAWDQMVRSAAQAHRAARSRMDDLRRGGALALLSSLEGRLDPAFEYVEHSTRFDELFAGAAKPTTISAGREPDTIPDGARIVFAEGTHEWWLRGASSGARFPRDVVLEGQGIGRTTVKLQTIETWDDVFNLTLRDLTIDCLNGPLFKAAQSRATITIERCRVIGFDSGGGGSAMIQGAHLALRASDSQFEGGHGKAPGFGHLFDVKGPVLARLDRCVIRGPLAGMWRKEPFQTYLFRTCAFERADSLRGLDAVPTNVRLVDAKVDGKDFTPDRSR